MEDKAAPGEVKLIVENGLCPGGVQKRFGGLSGRLLDKSLGSPQLSNVQQTDLRASAWGAPQEAPMRPTEAKLGRFLDIFKLELPGLHCLPSLRAPGRLRGLKSRKQSNNKKHCKIQSVSRHRLAPRSSRVPFHLCVRMAPLNVSEEFHGTLGAPPAPQGSFEL